MAKIEGVMSFGNAAREILKTSKKPLGPIEIVNEAIKMGLIVTHSKRPGATMAGRLWSDKRFVSAGNGKWKLQK